GLGWSSVGGDRQGNRGQCDAATQGLATARLLSFLVPTCLSRSVSLLRDQINVTHHAGIVHESAPLALSNFMAHPFFNYSLTDWIARLLRSCLVAPPP